MQKEAKTTARSLVAVNRESLIRALDLFLNFMDTIEDSVTKTNYKMVFLHYDTEQLALGVKEVLNSYLVHKIHNTFFTQEHTSNEHITMFFNYDSLKSLHVLAKGLNGAVLHLLYSPEEDGIVVTDDVEKRWYVVNGVEAIIGEEAAKDLPLEILPASDNSVLECNILKEEFRTLLAFNKRAKVEGASRNTDIADYVHFIKANGRIYMLIGDQFMFSCIDVTEDVKLKKDFVSVPRDFLEIDSNGRSEEIYFFLRDNLFACIYSDDHGTSCYYNKFEQRSITESIYNLVLPYLTNDDYDFAVEAQYLLDAGNTVKAFNLETISFTPEDHHLEVRSVDSYDANFKLRYPALAFKEKKQGEFRLYKNVFKRMINLYEYAQNGKKESENETVYFRLTSKTLATWIKDQKGNYKVFTFSAIVSNN